MPPYYSFKVSESPVVYSPSEDTWFMAKVITDFLKGEVSKNPYQTVCEVGVGSGYILITIGMSYPGLRLIGIDISFESVKLCKKNLEAILGSNVNQRCDLICTDFFSCLKKGFKPEIIFFNPPYVRTSLEEMNRKDPVSLSFAGGPSGVVVIKRFLEEVKMIDFQVVFFLTSNWNDNSLLFDEYSDLFQFKVVAQKRLPDERLICYKVTKN